uniref:Zinc finger protein 830 n=1 Tax=Anthurium amnicola TaxID=1678845 RepID=A0A1D1XTY2_9ARAE
MDAKKALFRAKLREASQKREKRIDSPLVRYNEHDQPVCKVCNITLKSDSLWPAHQVSRKHHEAIENLKALAIARDLTDAKSDQPKGLQKPRSSSALPTDFFDTPETKRQRTVSMDLVSSSFQDGRKEVQTSEECSNVDLVETRSMVEPASSSQVTQPSRKVDCSQTKLLKGTLPEGFFDKNEMSESQYSDLMNQRSNGMDVSEVKLVKGSLPESFSDSKARNENIISKQLHPSSKVADGSGVKQTKGALPEGFFDNKDADLRARGIQPVKVDIADAYKEFEKEIQDNLQEVDDRLEEEEIDAAVMRAEFELVEQMQYRDRVEMVKKKLIEAKTSQLARGQKPPAFMGQESSDESSSDSGDEENFTVDWRAKHL